MTMNRWQRWTCATLTCGVLSAGCAGAQGAPDGFDPENTPVTTISYDFEPTIAQARIGEDGRIETHASDVPQLSSEANAYLRADDYEEALRLYDLVLEATFDEEYERVAHYNRALSLEGMME